MFPKPPPIAAGTDPDLPQAPKRRPLRAALLCAALLLGLLLLTLLLPGGWQDWRRREAFLPALERQAARTPGDGRLWALVGTRRLEAGEYAGASDAFRQALAGGEANALLWQELAAAAAAAGDRRRAAGDLHLGLKAFPDSPALEAALADARAAGPQASPDMLARAIAPDGPAPLLAVYAPPSRLDGLGAWLARRRPEESGYDTRRDWAEQTPMDAQAQRLWGEALHRNRRIPEALAALSHAAALDPHSPTAALALAELLDEQHLPSKALGFYVRSLSLRPDSLPALLGLGHAAVGADLPKYAVPAYRRATEKAPQNADAWIGLGQAEAQEPDLIQAAVSAFQKARQLAPGRTDFSADYANAVLKSNAANTGPGSPGADAEALLRGRIAAVPGDSLAHYLLGTLLVRQTASPTSQAAAEAETRTALALSPENPLAEIQLAHLLLEKHEALGAIRLLTSALAATPDNVPALRTLGQAYARTGQAQRAAAVFARAGALTALNSEIKRLRAQEKTQPLDGAVHARLAALYRRKGGGRRCRRRAEHGRFDPERPAGRRRAAQCCVGFSPGHPEAALNRLSSFFLLVFILFSSWPVKLCLSRPQASALTVLMLGEGG